MLAAAVSGNVSCPVQQMFICPTLGPGPHGAKVGGAKMGEFTG